MTNSEQKAWNTKKADKTLCKKIWESTRSWGTHPMKARMTMRRNVAASKISVLSSSSPWNNDENGDKTIDMCTSEHSQS